VAGVAAGGSEVKETEMNKEQASKRIDFARYGFTEDVQEKERDNLLRYMYDKDFSEDDVVDLQREMDELYARIAKDMPSAYQAKVKKGC